MPYYISVRAPVPNALFPTLWAECLQPRKDHLGAVSRLFGMENFVNQVRREYS